MAIEFIESFGHYAIADSLQKGWTNTSCTFNATGGPRGGPCLALSSFNNSYVRPVPASSTRTVGFRFKKAANPSTSRSISMFHVGTTVISHLQINTLGQLVYSGGGGATGTTVLANDTWYYIEWSMLFSNTTTVGRAVVKLNGATEIDFTGDTVVSGTNVNANTFYLGGGAAQTITLNFADLYIEGAFDTFAGDHAVDAFVPSGAGNSTQFTPSAGSNFQAVDEASANGDTDYVESSTVGHKDLYAMGNLPAGAASVKAVQTVIQARKNTAGARTGRIVVRSGAADYEGSDIALADGYSMYRDMRVTDPATSAAWTVSGVNAMESGVKVQA